MFFSFVLQEVCRSHVVQNCLCELLFSAVLSMSLNPFALYPRFSASLALHFLRTLKSWSSICRDMQVRRVTISFGCLRALVLIKSLLFVHPKNHQRNLLFIESVCPGIQISVEFLCLSGMIIGRARQMEIGRRLRFLYILNTSHVSHVSLYFEFIFYTCHQMNAFALRAGGIFEACADLGIPTSPFPTDDQIHL